MGVNPTNKAKEVVKNHKDLIVSSTNNNQKEKQKTEIKKISLEYILNPSTKIREWKYNIESVTNATKALNIPDEMGFIYCSEHNIKDGFELLKEKMVKLHLDEIEHMVLSLTKLNRLQSTSIK